MKPILIRDEIRVYFCNSAWAGAIGGQTTLARGFQPDRRGPATTCTTRDCGSRLTGSPTDVPLFHVARRKCKLQLRSAIRGHGERKFVDARAARKYILSKSEWSSGGSVGLQFIPLWPPGCGGQ